MGSLFRGGDSQGQPAFLSGYQPFHLSQILRVYFHCVVDPDFGNVAQFLEGQRIDPLAYFAHRKQNFISSAIADEAPDLVNAFTIIGESADEAQEKRARLDSLVDRKSVV